MPNVSPAARRAAQTRGPFTRRALCSQKTGFLNVSDQ